MPANTYNSDLNAVSFPYREPLRAFCEDGVIPKQQTVLAACGGDFLRALDSIKDPRDLSAILHFLHNHVSPFAWGSPLRMANWEYMCSARADDVAIGCG